MLTRCLACLGLLLALLPAARAAGTSPPSGVYAGLDVTQPSSPSAGGVSDARKLYEQVNALLVIHGLAMTKDQMKQLLPLLQSLQKARQTFQATAGDLWAKNGTAVQGALDEVVAGQPLGPSLAAVQAPLDSFAQAAATLQRANQKAAEQLDTLLGPAAEGLYETLPRYLLREQSEQLLGGAANLQEYLANQVDVVRGLDRQDYQLVRYWEAERLAALLRPTVAAGFSYVQARMLDMLDRLYLQNDTSYTQQRPGLADKIAQYLYLPAAVRPAYFTFNEIALLLTSDQSVQVVEQLLGQTPQPVPVPDPALAQRAQQMRDAAAQARALQLAGMMRLTIGQLRAMQPLIRQAAAAMEPAQTAPDSALTGREASLHELRDLLLTGTANSAVPADLQQMWLGLQAELQADRQKAVGTASDALEQTRDLLTVAQTALLDWPGALTGGRATRQAQLEELQGVAAQMLRGYAFFDLMRHVRVSIYPHIRMARARDLLAEYLPANSPAFPQAQSFVLNLVSQARYATDEQWSGVWPPLVTQLMVGLGAVPGPGAVIAAARPVAWADYFTTLSDPQAPVIVGKVVGKGGY